MADSNPLTSIPALYRKVLYVIYGLFALVVGCLLVYYQAISDHAVPDWLVGLTSVVAYLGIPFGALAGSNVGPRDGPPPAPSGPGHPVT